MIVGLVSERGVDFRLEVVDVVRDEVRQVRVLGVAPHRLDRVELRAIGGQLLELDPFPALLKNPLLGRSVNAPAVPHHDQRPAEFFPQATEELNDVAGLHVLALHVEAAAHTGAAWRQRDRSDHAQPIASVPRALHGRLAPRRPGAAVH